MTRSPVQRWAAFTTDPAGGNPAGVVTDADDLDDAAMLEIAAEVGYSETAFTTGSGRERGIRYFSPVAEVPFCGHATIATAVALAETEGDGPFVFDTPVGPVRITTTSGPDGRVAAFTSVEPWVHPLDGPTLAAVLDVLGVGAVDLHPSFAPAVVFAGNTHPLIVLGERTVFDGLIVDAAAARALMDAEGWPATIIVLLPVSEGVWESRNVFPVGAIVEDPATGAAAAATGAYLRARDAGSAPASIEIRQGRHVGRPGLLRVDVPSAGGITVSGAAARITASDSRSGSA